MTPADQFFALADETRCKVVEMLSARPMPVHELTAAFSISRPAISRHLRVLKRARLVKEIKRGRENIYSLQRQNLQPLQGWLDRQGGVATPALQTKSKTRSAKPKTADQSVTATLKVGAEIEPVAKPRSRSQPSAPSAQAQLALF